MTADADPIVAAVADALLGARLGYPIVLGAAEEDAAIAVTAHRRAVLDQRDDGERWARLGEVAQAKLAKSPPGAEVVHVRPAMLHEMVAALTALADAEIARRQAEAERDDQVERATEAHVLADQMRRERDAMGRPVWDMLATARDQERHAANDGTT